MRRTDSPSALPKPGLYFDRVADVYDRVRTGYPTRLFDDMLAFAGSPPVKRALEIGCATGQATLPLANRGIRLVCLEPGNNLAEIARRNLAPFKNVEIICARFEDWIPEAEPFDLVFAANAIHWVNRKARSQKTARVLRAEGTLAVFRSFPVRSDSAIERAIDAAIEEVSTTNEEPDRIPREYDFRNSGYFERFEKFRYESRQEYDADTYIDLLSTLNRYRKIESAARAERFRKVRDIIMVNDGKITVHYVTHLLLARRRSRRSWLTRYFTALSQRR